MSNVITFKLKGKTMSENDRANLHANAEFKKKHHKDEPSTSREYMDWGNLWTEYFQFHQFRRG